MGVEDTVKDSLWMIDDTNLAFCMRAYIISTDAYNVTDLAARIKHRCRAVYGVSSRLPSPNPIVSRTIVLADMFNVSNAAYSRLDSPLDEVVCAGRFVVSLFCRGKGKIVVTLSLSL